MSIEVRHRVLAAIVAAAALAGCGGEQAAEERPDLASPILPSCGIAGYQAGEPERHEVEGEPSGWTIGYTSKPSGGGGQAQTGQRYIQLTEESPELPARGIQEGRWTTVDGHRVSLRTVTDPAVSRFAQWRTEQARYLTVAIGASPTEIRRLIRCLP